MGTPRWVELYQALQHPGPSSLGSRICSEALTRLEADDAAISLVIEDAYSLVATTSHRASLLEEEQFVVGEGPSFVGANGATPVIVDDLAASAARALWPSFARSAAEQGVRAAFAFPVRIGDARVGILTAYRVEPGTLSAEAYEDGILLGRFSAELLLQMQAGVTGTALAPVFDPGVTDQARLQQAAGMVAEQLSLSVVDAMVRLRAAAFAAEISLDELVRQILDRTLSLEP